jgi:hypothetical protein
MPSGVALSEEIGVSRPVISSMLKILVSEGHIAVEGARENICVTLLKSHHVLSPKRPAQICRPEAYNFGNHAAQCAREIARLDNLGIRYEDATIKSGRPIVVAAHTEPASAGVANYGDVRG